MLEQDDSTLVNPGYIRSQTDIVINWIFVYILNHVNSNQKLRAGNVLHHAALITFAMWLYSNLCCTVGTALCIGYDNTASITLTQLYTMATTDRKLIWCNALCFKIFGQEYPPRNYPTLFAPSLHSCQVHIPPPRHDKHSTAVVMTWREGEVAGPLGY